MATLRLSRKVGGLVSAPRTLVFLAGFPDDHASWDALRQHFDGEYRVITLTLPGFSSEADEPKVPRWGFGFDDIVTMMDAAISEVQTEPFILVGHDWGSYVTMRYLERFPEKVAKYVTLDIGVMDSPLSKEVSLKSTLVISIYQLCLATSFVFQAVGLSAFGYLTMALFPWKLVGPTPYETKLPKRTKQWASRPDLAMGYPYLHVWMAVLTGKMKLMKHPKPPTLFLFGRKKRVMFHNEKFLCDLEGRTDGSRWEAFDCGHFIQAQKPDEAAKAMKAFLKDTK